MIQHINPKPERTASAPYNFIALPDKVVPILAAEDLAQCETIEEKRELLNDRLPDQDRYHPDRKTGYFQVTLTTKSPLFIRGPLPRTLFDREAQGLDRNGQEVTKQTRYADRIKNEPDFFYTQDANQPVIPGSSLRGMLRALVEIISYGKLSWVTDRRLFFRTVDGTAVGKYYRDRMIERVETGFLRRVGERYVVRKCAMARVRREDHLPPSSTLYDGRSPNKTPNWQYQYRAVWVQCSEDEKKNRLIRELAWEKPNSPGWREGRLVITGDMSDKKREFVFLLPEEEAEEVTISREILQRFHDDDQITQWQEKAFPRDQPDRGCRERDGMLSMMKEEPGEPIFFLREEDKVSFFGRAGMFRLPYRHSPQDLIPSALREENTIDYAEAIFGYVGKQLLPAEKQGSKARAYAGRLFVTDATLAPGQENVFEEIITPKILATPKPTAFQHYLMQPSEETNPQALQETLSHYDSPTYSERRRYSPKTYIRGHKLYWHQGNRSLDKIKESDPQWMEGGQVKPTSTQHTRMRPVRPETTFTFKVTFGNLSDRELGALCWALQPQGEGDYCHKLGMGKPLGLGAVKLDATLHLSDRSARYKTLFDAEGEWQTAETESDIAPFVQAFEEHLLETLKPERACPRLANLDRIWTLLKILEWPGMEPVEGGKLYLEEEDRPNTRYMTIKPNEYRDRRVLPDVFGFFHRPKDIAAPARDTKGIKEKRTDSPEERGTQKNDQKIEVRRKEWVTVVQATRKGAIVRTESSPTEIPCKNIPPHPTLMVEAVKGFRADVTYQNGKPVSAIWKSWM